MRELASSDRDVQESGAPGRLRPEGEPARPTGPRGLVETLMRVVREHTFAVVIGAMLLWLIAGPLWFLIRMSLGTGTPANPGPLTLANYETMLGDGRTYSALGNTVLYSVATTVISLTLATAAAWLVERTDLPGRNLAWIAMLAPIAIPGVLASMAWILLLSPGTGALNVFLRNVVGLFGIQLETGPFNIYSLWGMIFVEGIRGTTSLFLLIVGAFRLMDPSLEDASSLSGANPAHTLRRITLPLLAPALIAAAIYSFLGNLQDFETPLLLGLPANIFILPTLIYFVAYASSATNWGLAAAYASLFLVVLVVLATLYFTKIIKHSRRFQTVAGKAYRPQRIKLGGWRHAASASFGVFFLVSMGLPLLVLVWTSLLPGYQLPSFDALDNITLDNYRRLFTDSQMLRAFRNSISLAVGTATIGMGLAFVVSWTVVRLRVRGGLLLDGMAFLPNALPSITIGLGFVVFYLSPFASWTKLYGTITVMVLALVVNYLAFSTRLGNSAMVQLSAELEEQAWVAGYTKASTLMRVTSRLLFPTFVAGWVWIFAHAVRNLSMPLLLGTTRNEVVSVRLYYAWAVEGSTAFASTIAVALLVVLMFFAVAARRLITRGFTE